MMTRRMRDTESAMTLNFYRADRVYSGQSSSMGLMGGRWAYGTGGGGTLAFLFRPWHMPACGDLVGLSGHGNGAVGMWWA
jgi:hypothetical protein